MSAFVRVIAPTESANELTVESAGKPFSASLAPSMIQVCAGRYWMKGSSRSPRSALFRALHSLLRSA